jgi:hypothetical protein
VRAHISNSTKCLVITPESKEEQNFLRRFTRVASIRQECSGIVHVRGKIGTIDRDCLDKYQESEIERSQLYLMAMVEI